MKSNILNYVVGACALLSLGACSKKLELFPASDIELSQSFQTVKDAETWNNGLYAQLRGRVYGIYMYSTDVQADQLNASLEFGNRNGNPHRWEGFLADDYTIRDVWSGYYSAITNINLTLEGYPGIEPQSDDEATAMNRYLGDAYLGRAFYYHQLMRRFGQPYNPASAATDKGVPLVLEYDIFQQPERASVEQVYSQILADIQQAKTLLAAVPGSAGASRFTLDAAIALEARVKLYMQDWPGAKAAADILINSGTYPLATTAAAIEAMWYDDAPTESIMMLTHTAPNELGNTNAIYLGFRAGENDFRPDFIPSQWVIDMYADDDYRKDVYFDTKPIDIQSIKRNVVLVNKYPGNPDLFTTAATNYQHEQKVFRIAEMYLISAEAGARQGGASAVAALGVLNTLRNARNLGSLVATGAALLDAVKEERFRELAFEGFRLDDLIRWNEGFTRRDPQFNDIIQTGSNYQTKSVQANDPKFIWGLPTNDVTVNPNLAQNQNPGW